MIDIFKTRLPEGLEIESVEDYSRFSYLVTFNYKGICKTKSFLHKKCAPGKEKLVCDLDVSIAMIYIGLRLNDAEMTRHWKAKQEWIFDLWTMAEKSSKKQQTPVKSSKRQ